MVRCQPRAGRMSTGLIVRITVTNLTAGQLLLPKSICMSKANSSRNKVTDSTAAIWTPQSCTTVRIPSTTPYRVAPTVCDGPLLHNPGQFISGQPWSLKVLSQLGCALLPPPPGSTKGQCAPWIVSRMWHHSEHYPTTRGRPECIRYTPSMCFPRHGRYTSEGD